MYLSQRLSRIAMAIALSPPVISSAAAQGPTRQAPVISPEVQPDRHVTFRLTAPQATEVRLNASDIPGVGSGTMTKSEGGVWEITVGPLEPGAYRYTFNVAGVTTVDPRSPGTSESNNNVWSLVVVPGSDLMDARNVPHGAVSSVAYYSTALGRFRRMHVYTPPDYDLGKGRYPVFYLLHGAGDSDDSWTSVGRAGFILDNLIAAGKAVPMVVVMPAGHTRPFGRPAPAPSAGSQPPVDEFTRDFVGDIMPYVEKNYRVLKDRSHRAMAGLSMGGGQTLSIGLSHLDEFAYLGVFSSGLFEAFPPNRPGSAPSSAGPSAWEQQHAADLDNASLKKGLKLVWFSTGKDDFLLRTTQGTVDLLKRHGFQPIYTESTGGHTWLNWRDYLIVFAPQLFR